MKKSNVRGFTRSSLRIGLMVAIAACCGASQAQTRTTPELDRRIDESIREHGVLESARSVDIRSRVRGQVAILVMVPEGTTVKKDELIVELDDSALREVVQKNKIELARTRAALDQAQFALESAKRQGNGRVTVAKKALAVAMIEREQVLGKGGELATKLIELDGQLAVAKSQYETASKLLELATKENDVKNVVELQAAQLEAREMIRVNEARKRYVAESETNHRKAASELAIVERELEVLTQTSKQESMLQAAVASLSAQHVATEIAKRNLDETMKQLESCKIRAPQDGFVVYPSTGSARSRRSVLEPGEMVRERQVIARLPDPKQLQVRVLVNESRIAQVRQGQSATIRFDAFPENKVAGTVTHISSAPEPSSWVSQDVKEYAVVVSLKKPIAGLRLGLSASVQIDVK